MAQRPAAPPGIQDVASTLKWTDYVLDNNVWLSCWQCKYCMATFVGSPNPVTRTFPVQYNGNNVDLMKGCPDCVNGTLAEKRSALSTIALPASNKRIVKRFDTACSWPRQDPNREAVLEATPLTDTARLAKALVADDDIREQLNSHVSNKNVGSTSSTAQGADNLFRNVMSKNAGSNSTIPASVFVSVFEETIMQSQASAYERAYLLYGYLTSPEKTWRTLADATGRRGPLFVFPLHLLRACDLAVTQDGEAAARKDWCNTVANRLIRSTLNDYKVALGHSEDGDVQHFLRLCTLRQCATEHAADFALRVRKEAESFNNRKFHSDGGVPVAISDQLIDLIFKAGIHPEIINNFTPPLGDRPIRTAKADDMSNLKEIENRVRRGQNWPAPLTGAGSAERHEQDNALLTKRYEQLLVDHQKIKNKGGKPASNDTDRRKQSSETDKADGGKPEAKKQSNYERDNKFHCWFCDTVHDDWCAKINQFPDKALPTWHRYVAAKYKVTEDELKKIAMPLSMADMKSFWSDMKPKKIKFRPGK